MVPLLAGAVAPWFFLVALFDPSRGGVEAPASAHLPACGSMGVALLSVVVLWPSFLRPHLWSSFQVHRIEDLVFLFFFMI